MIYATVQKKQRYEAKYLAKIEKMKAKNESQEWAFLDEEQANEIALINFLKNYRVTKK